MKKSQETGWLGNMLSWGQRRQMQRSETLYTNAVEMARNPLFYNKFDVKDDVDGRFDARVSSHGQVIDEAELNEIEPGVTNRAGVIALLGRPSFEGAFESGKIYYLNDVMIEPAAGRKRTTTRTLVVFIFDDSNVVEDIEVRDESTGQVIANLDKKTPTPGDNYTLAEQLFSTLRRRGN